MASVGELFISLGVKGAEKTVGAITTVKDGLKGIAATSLETKAAIIASIYAIERLFEASGQRGTALENFNALTGVATKTVQQYQWAAQQVGVSNEEVSSSFVNLQKNMTKTLLGKGAPEGLGMFAQKGGNVTAEDIARYQEHPEELLQKLQQYAHTEKNKGLRNDVLSSFGLGGNMISALDRNAFSPEMLKKAPTYSDSQISNLDKANAAWKNLGTTIEMIFGKINAKHGLGFVNDISKLLPPIQKVVAALVSFAEKVHLFEGLGKIFDGMAKAIDTIGSAIERLEKSKALTTFMKSLSESYDFFKKNPITSIVNPTNLKEGFNEILDLFSSLLPSSEEKPNEKPKISPKSKLDNVQKNKTNAAIYSAPAAPNMTPAIIPNAPTINNAASTQNISVNQTMTFQGGDSNPKEAAHAFKRDVQSAARQLSSLGQGS